MTLFVAKKPKVRPENYFLNSNGSNYDYGM